MSDLLRTEGLCVSLPSSQGQRPIFDHVSIHLDAHEVVDVVGPSGCGKTTLLRALSLLLPGSTGHVALRGADAATFGAQEWRAHVSMLPQSPALVEGTVEDNLLLPFTLAVRQGRERPDSEATRALLDEVGLSDVELERDVSRLSLGQSARIALCRTLVTKPDVLLLDEADASLDEASMERIGQVVSTYVGSGDCGCLRIRHREPDGFTTRRIAFREGTFVEEGVA